MSRETWLGSPGGSDEELDSASNRWVVGRIELRADDGPAGGTGGNNDAVPLDSGAYLEATAEHAAFDFVGQRPASLANRTPGRRLRRHPRGNPWSITRLRL